MRYYPKAADIVLHRPQHTSTRPDPEYAVKKAVNTLLAAPRDFFDRHNQQLNAVRSIIGSHAAQRS